MNKHRRTSLRLSAAAVAGLLLTGCGFQLRGSTNLPFKSIHLGLPESSPLGNELKRYIRASGETDVVSDRKAAEAVFDVLAEARDKQVLSLNSQGRVREYALIYRLSYRVLNNQQKELQPPTEIVIKRDISFNESAALSKESEEGLLYRDMQSDMVQQILRRLAAIQPQA